jgi:hypothetical protein
VIGVNLCLAALSGSRLGQQPLHGGYPGRIYYPSMSEALILILRYHHSRWLVTLDDMHGATPEAIFDGSHATALEFGGGKSIHVTSKIVLQFTNMIPIAVLTGNMSFQISL